MLTRLADGYNWDSHEGLLMNIEELRMIKEALQNRLDEHGPIHALDEADNLWILIRKIENMIETEEQSEEALLNSYGFF